MNDKNIKSILPKKSFIYTVDSRALPILSHLDRNVPAIQKPQPLAPHDKVTDYVRITIAKRTKIGPMT